MKVNVTIEFTTEDRELVGRRLGQDGAADHSTMRRFVEVAVSDKLDLWTEVEESEGG